MFSIKTLVGLFWTLSHPKGFKSPEKSCTGLYIDCLSMETMEEGDAYPEGH